MARRFVFGNATLRMGLLSPWFAAHKHGAREPLPLPLPPPSIHPITQCFDLQPGISPRFAEWHDQTYPRFGSDFIILGLATLLAICHGVLWHGFGFGLREAF
ncbi:hypothetical protein F5Y00DRAFT_258618 [Daldinia vernicosa]|uniref:uncharacterized protein n=1 Tax=Daldinia vernicosa TaxID=114800 RepID=UPI002008C29E|nr:uncharacterized protein F5Y00DRAFT_258618 [Daldinia vernicosa]KAI0852204.1 hypothetical protein F5Y00DRAFT_258618 [Daldinia vernicosa]